MGLTSSRDSGGGAGQLDSTEKPASPPPPPRPPPRNDPYNFKEIIRREKATVDERRKAEIYSPPGRGIILAEKTKKYWVDTEDNNCFMIFPKGLSITWMEDRRYWVWTEEPEEASADGKIDAAELLDVCWLEIHGKLELSYLNPGVTYEVFFEIKMKDGAYGWEKPVDLRLKLPDGSVQERKESLDKKPKGKWMLLKVGEIQPQRGQNGDVAVSLFRYGGAWKRGLIIKAIVIIPKEW